MKAENVSFRIVPILLYLCCVLCLINMKKTESVKNCCTNFSKKSTLLSILLAWDMQNLQYIAGLNH
jgi:hypothetical protein